MKGRSVYDVLAQGPATLEQIKAATGMSSNHVYVAIARLKEQGYRITNRSPRGRGRGHRAVYVLESRLPGPGICAYPGCTTRLSRYHRDTYCYAHRDQINDRKLAACREQSRPAAPERLGV